MTERDCAHVSCNQTGGRARKVVATDSIKWYCPDHDPLEDPRVAEGFEAVGEEDNG